MCECLRFQMEKLTENMIRWAESKLGSTEYAGWSSVIGLPSGIDNSDFRRKFH